MESNSETPGRKLHANDAAAERRPPVRQRVHPVDAYFLHKSSASANMLDFVIIDVVSSILWYGWAVPRVACGNVMHVLASLCHEAGNGVNNGRRCPKYARTVFLPDLDSINSI